MADQPLGGPEILLQLRVLILKHQLPIKDSNKLLMNQLIFCHTQLPVFILFLLINQTMELHDQT